MKRISFILLLSSFGLVSANAQNKKEGYRFHSINNVGWLDGKGASSMMVQTINGFSKGSWFGGLGVAMDFYRYRTFPVFADLRYEFGKTGNRFFVYGDGGVNLDWVQPHFMRESFAWNGNLTNDFKSGFYSDIGIGVSLRLKKEKQFLLSVGHTGKTLKELVSYDDWISDKRITDVYKYHLNRIVFKLGFKF